MCHFDWDGSLLVVVVMCCGLDSDEGLEMRRRDSFEGDALREMVHVTNTW